MALRSLSRSAAVCGRTLRNAVPGESSCSCARGLSSAALNRAVEVEVPFARLLALVSSPFEASLSELSRPKRKQTPEEAAALELFMPSIPKFLCVTRMAAESQLLRSVLVVDVTKPPLKPRMSWYNPYDTTWAPSGWYKDGLVAEMRYYYANAA